LFQLLTNAISHPASGSSTDTYDAEGRFTQQSTTPVNVTEEQFNEVLQRFIGEIEQTPPAYSAVKVHGRKAYEMAREGEEVELAPRKINVYHLEVLEWALRKWSLMCTAPPEHMYVRWQMMWARPWAAEPIWSGYAAPNPAGSPCGRHASAQASRDFYRRELYQFLIPAAEPWPNGRPWN